MSVAVGAEAGPSPAVRRTSFGRIPGPNRGQRADRGRMEMAAWAARQSLARLPGWVCGCGFDPRGVAGRNTEGPKGAGQETVTVVSVAKSETIMCKDADKNPEDAKPPTQGIACRECGCRHLYTTRVRKVYDGMVRRRRQCRSCGFEFTTHEFDLGKK